MFPSIHFAKDTFKSQNLQNYEKSQIDHFEQRSVSTVSSF